jgi:hypothetical protein
MCTFQAVAALGAEDGAPSPGSGHASSAPAPVVDRIGEVGSGCLTPVGAPIQSAVTRPPVRCDGPIFVHALQVKGALAEICGEDDDDPSDA